MFPKDHVITYAYVGNSLINRYEQVPARYVQLTNDPDAGKMMTPEQFVATVDTFPKSILLWGDPLSVETDFLEMVLVELTNGGHIVTLKDYGRRRIPNRLFMPGVRLDLWYDERFNDLTWHKLRETDLVRIPVIGEDRYETIRDLVQDKMRFVKAQFELSGSTSLLSWVLSDKLDVRVSQL